MLPVPTTHQQLSTADVCMNGRQYQPLNCIDLSADDLFAYRSLVIVNTSLTVWFGGHLSKKEKTNPYYGPNGEIREWCVGLGFGSRYQMQVMQSLQLCERYANTAARKEMEQTKSTNSKRGSKHATRNPQTSSCHYHHRKCENRRLLKNMATIFFGIFNGKPFWMQSPSSFNCVALLCQWGMVWNSKFDKCIECLVACGRTGRGTLVASSCRCTNPRQIRRFRETRSDAKKAFAYEESHLNPKPRKWNHSVCSVLVPLLLMKRPLQERGRLTYLVI